MKEKLLERYRYINVEDDLWYDYIIENFKNNMDKRGIEVGAVEFDLYYRTAAFDAVVYDWELFMKSLGYNEEELIEFAIDHWSFRSKAWRGKFDLDYDIFIPDEDVIDSYSPYDDDLRTKVWRTILMEYDPEKIEEEVIETFEEASYDLLSKLEKEYDYLTSDEAVWQTLEANGLIDEEEINEEEEEEDENV